MVLVLGFVTFLNALFASAGTGPWWVAILLGGLTVVCAIKAFQMRHPPRRRT